MVEVDEKKPDSTFSGLRKLIRPRLSSPPRRHEGAFAEPALTARQTEPNPGPASHAEAFYFQKQIQQQTEMVIVLEDGEEIRGVIEWYDKSVLKLRNGRHRILVYKSAVKYLFKDADAHPVGTVMK